MEGAGTGLGGGANKSYGLGLFVHVSCEHEKRINRVLEGAKKALPSEL